MRRATQADVVLTALALGRAITPLDALREFGVMRLGARVWELRQALGERAIASETVTAAGGKHVARYASALAGTQLGAAWLAAGGGLTTRALDAGDAAAVARLTDAYGGAVGTFADENEITYCALDAAGGQDTDVERALGGQGAGDGQAQGELL